MSMVQRFEDLIAWQKARVLTTEIYRVTRIEPFASDYGLRNQIQRSAVSAMSNIAEGFERGKRGEFHQFLINCKSIMCRSSFTIGMLPKILATLLNMILMT